MVKFFAQFGKKSLLADIRERGVFRMIFLLGFAVVGGFLFLPYASSTYVWLFELIRGPLSPSEQKPTPGFAVLTVYVVLGAAVGALVGAMLINLAEKLVARWDKFDGGQKATTITGIVLGVLLSLPFVVFFQALGIPIATIGFILIVLMVGLAAIMVYALNSIDEFLPWSKSRGRARRSGIKILDTNVIIDGRIYDVVRSGFLEGQLYVPGFVLDELQFIADSADGLRRQRGKRGLDVLRHLQQDFQLEVKVHDRLLRGSKEPVDSRLVQLAVLLGADLVTNDHNLNQVARLQDVRVLNINDLALSLRPNVLPTEHLKVTIIREGNQAGQGIGYLDDGTMVVIEGGKYRMNQEVNVEVTQVIQTERGKLIFGEIEDEVEVDDAESRKRSKKP
jgi:uncharacterized protein YacL